jgi:PEP-CTERM motif
MRKIFAPLLLCISLLCAVPAFADQTIGLPADTNNCFPFGCAYDGEYQQVYTASAFSGPITITNLEFFNTFANSGATSMNSGTWTIYLSTTSADWNSLSPTFSSNIGADNTMVFSGNLSQPWTFPDTLHINLTTPFTYTPGSGNLLMDVVVSGANDTGGTIGFDANDVNSIMGRVYNGGVTDFGSGLVTDFTTGAGATPEPSSIFLFGSGLVALLGAARRKLGK